MHISHLDIGEYCEKKIAFCSKEFNPCENGAKCTDHFTHYTCECPLGFEGQNCSVNIDDCANHMCQVCNIYSMCGVYYVCLFSSFLCVYRTKEHVWMASMGILANARRNLVENIVKWLQVLLWCIPRRLHARIMIVSMDFAFCRRILPITCVNVLPASLVGYGLKLAYK